MALSDKTMAIAEGLSETFQGAAEDTAPCRGRKPIPPPFSLRLTFEERGQLEREAGDMALGAYIRQKLFGTPPLAGRRRVKRPIQDHQALAKVLGELGRSRLASNLNQLAKAAHAGALPVTAEIQAELQEACAHIQAIRNDLISALGLKGEGTS